MNQTRMRLHNTVMAVCLATSVFCFANLSAAQEGFNQRHHGGMVPGVIGREQAALQHRLRGYFQAVELIAPQGARITFWEDGESQTSEQSDLTAGMLIGAVYRFKISGIPQHQGFEVFPTVELVNRLYTPDGKESQFPIPVHFTQEDLETALDGGFITRVVYLEDPRNALPLREIPGVQTVYDVSDRQDPLHEADRLGRPMAIVRLGSRVPDIVLQQGEEGFGYGSPPIRILSDDQPEAPADLPKGKEPIEPGPLVPLNQGGAIETLPNAAPPSR